MKCRTCKQKLKEIPQGFDSFGFSNLIKQMYCENKDCEEFGYVVVVGYPESSQLTEDNKDTNPKE